MNNDTIKDVRLLLLRLAELVTIWLGRSVGSQESFGYLITDFLNEHPSIVSRREDVEAVLIAAKRIAAKSYSKAPI